VHQVGPAFLNPSVCSTGALIVFLGEPVKLELLHHLRVEPVDEPAFFGTASSFVEFVVGLLDCRFLGSGSSRERWDRLGELSVIELVAFRISLEWQIGGFVLVVSGGPVDLVTDLVFGVTVESGEALVPVLGKVDFNLFHFFTIGSYFISTNSLEDRGSGQSEEAFGMGLELPALWDGEQTFVGGGEVGVVGVLAVNDGE